MAKGKAVKNTKMRLNAIKQNGGYKGIARKGVDSFELQQGIQYKKVPLHLQSMFKEKEYAVSALPITRNITKRRDAYFRLK